MLLVIAGLRGLYIEGAAGRDGFALFYSIVNYGLSLRWI
jgi:hypothetical protein